MDDPRSEVLEYLAGHRVMTLATVGEEGPWAAAVYYVNDGLELEFLSAPHTRHARNVERYPGVSITIQDQDDDWLEIRGIQLEGRVDRLWGAAREAAIRRYAGKFTYLPFDHPALSGPLQVVDWYRIRPVRIFWIDNRLAFGRRVEIMPDARGEAERGSERDAEAAQEAADLADAAQLAEAEELAEAEDDADDADGPSPAHADDDEGGEGSTEAEGSGRSTEADEPG